MYAYGAESPSEVDRQMVGIVALIWFGSLALIASVTGVMLSLAGFYMRRELMAQTREKEEKEKAEQALKDAVTKATIDSRGEELEGGKKERKNTQVVV